MRLPDDEAGWARLPPVIEGEIGPLPGWARTLAVHLPRTTAAILEVDAAQRTLGPLDPALRAKIRWVIAHANRSAYGEASALADARRAGMGPAALATLTGNPASWPAGDRDALEFARRHTLDAPAIPDELFARVQARFGYRGAAAIVLLGAYGNFQDRLALGLGLEVEPDGPPPPLSVRFAADALATTPILPAEAERAGDRPAEAGGSVVSPDPTWGGLGFDALQARLEAQRDQTPRLPIPPWEEVRRGLPAAFAAQPTRIVWSLVCYGYVPELAVPWSIATRTLGAEAGGDRVFEESLFWVQTRAVGCNYCMGHCEMLLEVAGLDRTAVVERLQLLAGDDWSAFPAGEQRAFAYARKLARAPWELTPADLASLERDLGPRRALATLVWLCRGLYMTRISDGFQLPLERENVFLDYYQRRTEADRAAR